jgi:L-threonylcarbamoyladenylate synthase
MDTKTLYISVNSSEFEQSEEFLQCTKDLRAGKLVIFPTETVYGLGAVINHEESLQEIFRAKGRPSDNPLIVHIGEMEQIWQIIERDPPELFWKLSERFWPGPVTFILKKAKGISETITGNRDSVAIRFPSNRIAQRLIALCGVPVAAPSANISGYPSPTRPEHLEEMKGRVQWIIETEPLEFGIESTIISLLEETPVLLRPGPVTTEKLKEMIPDLIVKKGMTEAIAPGMKYKHYSPNAEVKLIPWVRDKEELAEMGIRMFKDLCQDGNSEQKKALICTDETISYYKNANIDCISLGPREDLYRVASNLFHVLRVLDKNGIHCALIEGFEEKGLGITIMNRVKKATSK